MRVRIYQAPNIGAAMAMVREELGPDALILSSQAFEDGVEVTAAFEPAPCPPDQAEAAQYEVDWPWHGVQHGLASRLSAGLLTARLEAEFVFSSLPCERSASTLLLVGPPGAGKTMTTARLATRLKLAGQNPHVITADGRRAGAAEQLAAFTRLLGLTLIVADTPTQLARAIARRPDRAPTLIDTPGLNPFEPADRDYLIQCHAVAKAQMALVLPAGLDPGEAAEMAAAFKELGAAYLIATRLDQSRRLGGVLAAAASGLTLTDAGVSAGVVESLQPISPSFLAERLARRTSPMPTKQPAATSPLALLVRSTSETPRAAP